MLCIVSATCAQWPNGCAPSVRDAPLKPLRAVVVVLLLRRWELQQRKPDFRHVAKGDPRRANEKPLPKSKKPHSRLGFLHGDSTAASTENKFAGRYSREDRFKPLWQLYGEWSAAKGPKALASKAAHKFYGGQQIAKEVSL